jgi:MFS family permease
MLTGFSNNLHQLILVRFFLGMAEGPMFPALARVISDWLPNQQKSLAFAISLISVPLSMAISGPILTQILEHYSWQTMYFILGGFSLTILPFWLIFFKNKASQSPFVNAEELLIIQDTPPQPKLSSDISWKKIVFHPTLFVNNIAYFIFGFYLFFFMNWLPALLKKEFNFALHTIGWMTVVPWVSAIIMMLAMGYLSDRIHRVSADLRKSRTYLIIFSQLASGLSLFFMLNSNPKYILLFLSLAVGFVMSGNSIYYAVVSDIIKPKAATALGIMVLFFALAGFIAPYLAGILINLYGNFNVIFIFMIILVLCSTLLLSCLHNKASQTIYD